MAIPLLDLSPVETVTRELRDRILALLQDGAATDDEIPSPDELRPLAKLE